MELKIYLIVIGIMFIIILMLLFKILNDLSNIRIRLNNNKESFMNINNKLNEIKQSNMNIYSKVDNINIKSKYIFDSCKMLKEIPKISSILAHTKHITNILNSNNTLFKKPEKAKKQ